MRTYYNSLSYTKHTPKAVKYMKKVSVKGDKKVANDLKALPGLNLKVR